MTDPMTITLPLVTLRNVKSVSKSDSGAGYADLAIRVTLGEAYQRALPFMNWCQETGTSVQLELSQVQLPFAQPDGVSQAEAPLEDDR